MKNSHNYLDQHFSGHQFGSGQHSTRIYASVQDIMQAIKELESSDVPMMRPLFFIRHLPAMLKHKLEKPEAAPILEHMHKDGFRIIHETENELVFGVIAKFWQASNIDPFIPEDLSTYKEEPPLGYAKAVGYFGIREGEATNAYSVLIHETRVLIPNAKTRKKFRPYWYLIYPGMLLLRKTWMWAIKKKAEKLAANKKIATL